MIGPYGDPVTVTQADGELRPTLGDARGRAMCGDVLKAMVSIDGECTIAEMSERAAEQRRE